MAYFNPWFMFTSVCASVHVHTDLCVQKPENSLDHSFNFSDQNFTDLLDK